MGEAYTTATVSILQIDNVTQCNKLMCCVSLEACDGPTVTADFIVDTYVHCGGEMQVRPAQNVLIFVSPTRQ